MRSRPKIAYDEGSAYRFGATVYRCSMFGVRRAVSGVLTTGPLGTRLNHGVARSHATAPLSAHRTSSTDRSCPSPPRRLRSSNGRRIRSHTAALIRDCSRRFACTLVPPTHPHHRPRISTWLRVLRRRFLHSAVHSSRLFLHPFARFMIPASRNRYPQNFTLLALYNSRRYHHQILHEI